MRHQSIFEKDFLLILKQFPYSFGHVRYLPKRVLIIKTINNFLNGKFCFYRSEVEIIAVVNFIFLANITSIKI